MLIQTLNVGAYIRSLQHRFRSVSSKIQLRILRNIHATGYRHTRAWAVFQTVDLIVIVRILTHFQPWERVQNSLFCRSQ